MLLVENQLPNDRLLRGGWIGVDIEDRLWDMASARYAFVRDWSIDCYSPLQLLTDMQACKYVGKHCKVV